MATAAEAPDVTKHLIDVCSMFLVPTSVLFAAIGIARTEGLKALVSFIGTCAGALWFYCVLYWPELQKTDSKVLQHTALGLAASFGAAALLSTSVHVRNWWPGWHGLKEWFRSRDKGQGDAERFQLPSGTMIVFIPREGSGPVGSAFPSAD